jgi:hypothetical protein
MLSPNFLNTTVVYKMTTQIGGYRPMLKRPFVTN